MKTLCPCYTTSFFSLDKSSQGDFLHLINNPVTVAVPQLDILVSKTLRQPRKSKKLNFKNVKQKSTYFLFFSYHSCNYKNSMYTCAAAQMQSICWVLSLPSAARKFRITWHCLMICKVRTQRAKIYYNKFTLCVYTKFIMIKHKPQYVNLVQKCAQLHCCW